MQTRTQAVAGLMAATLAFTACATGDADTDETEPTTETTTLETVPETTSASPETTVGDVTSTTTDDTSDTDTTDTVAGLDLDALDAQVDDLADQVEAAGNDALTGAWDELETQYDDVRDAIESGEVADLSSQDVTAALAGFETTVQENVDELDPALVTAWNELMADLETGITTLTG